MPAPAGGPAPVFLEVPCPDSDAPPPVRCGHVEVFEDRAAATGRTIALRTIVLGAIGDDPRPDPVFLLVGGPGQAAAEIALDIAGFLGDVRASRDVVMVDQRGTGASNGLHCMLPDDPSRAFGAIFPRDVIASCRRELEQRADLGLYDTSAFADDLDDVRRALGYQSINFSGGSYGTRAALVYAKRHPQSTRALVLDGTFPVTLHAGLPYARTADDSLRRIFADCRADAGCNGAYPDLEAKFDAMVANWKGPVEVEIEVPEHGKVTVALSLGDFGYGIRGIQYGPGGWRLPQRLWAAVTEGDFTEVAQAYYDRAAAIWPGLAIGHHLSVFCAEDLPFVDPEEIGPATEGTYLGRYLFDEYAEACELWVRGEIPSDFHEPTRSDVPVLMTSGARDPITPPRTAEKAAETLPNSWHLVYPVGSHGYTGGDDGGCKGELVQGFLDGASIDGFDESCVEAVVPAGFALP